MAGERGAAPRQDVVRRLLAAGCVFADDEAGLLCAAARTPSEFDAMVARRVGGVPVEQIVGWARFCGARITVGPGVFVPRPRTEFLVHQAIAVTRPGAVVVDLCCGSGAVGAAVAAAVGPIELHAVDIDDAAVTCARCNLAAAGAQVYAGDLYGPLPVRLQRRVDVLIANAPYVPTGDIALMPRESRLHESLAALDGGADGLDVQRRIVAEAHRWLRPTGQLLLETSEHQSRRTADIFRTAHMTTRVVSSKEYEATVVIGTAGRSQGDVPAALAGGGVTARLI
ncbi:MAG TPA: putative protein N(5)-glutamine methyltransferase [Nitriliruptorales bacterium]|nr:putative protein N(5)-glutamine methyltransferase [Nitriliruptorales bacterium]